ncbi:MAG TPA: SHOCT domain-containing protein [Gaiellaceae bacterium]
MGLFSKSTKPSDDLLQRGIRGTATVEEAHMGGLVTEYSGFMSQKKQEQLLTGETSMTKYKLKLLVQIPTKEPYKASVTVPVPMMKVRYMAGGSVIPVLVDPDKDDRIAVDWEGEFKQGTLADMAEANPIIAAAMKGAGVDIEKISEQQRAAAAAGWTPSNIVIGGQLMGMPQTGVPQPPAAAPDPLEQLKTLGELRASGVLTEAEFEAQKAKILGT